MKNPRVDSPKKSCTRRRQMLPGRILEFSCPVFWRCEISFALPVMAASVAQLVEQLTLNQLVVGSNPPRGTISHLSKLKREYPSRVARHWRSLDNRSLRFRRSWSEQFAYERPTRCLSWNLPTHQKWRGRKKSKTVRLRAPLTKAYQRSRFHSNDAVTFERKWGSPCEILPLKGLFLRSSKSAASTEEFVGEA